MLFIEMSVYFPHLSINFLNSMNFQAIFM